MKIFGFAGWSGSGKTTLIEKLIPRFVGGGLRVSLIKHAHHSFDVRLLRDIACHGDRAVAEAGSDLAYARAVDVGQHRPRTLEHEALGDRPPEARRGPRHDRDLAFKLHGLLSDRRV